MCVCVFAPQHKVRAVLKEHVSQVVFPRICLLDLQVCISLDCCGSGLSLLPGEGRVAAVPSLDTHSQGGGVRSSQLSSRAWDPVSTHKSRLWSCYQ